MAALVFMAFDLSILAFSVSDRPGGRIHRPVKNNINLRTADSTGGTATARLSCKLHAGAPRERRRSARPPRIACAQQRANAAGIFESSRAGAILPRRLLLKCRYKLPRPAPNR